MSEIKRRIDDAKQHGDPGVSIGFDEADALLGATQSIELLTDELSIARRFIKSHGLTAAYSLNRKRIMAGRKGGVLGAAAREANRKSNVAK